MRYWQILIYCDDVITVHSSNVKGKITKTRLTSILNLAIFE